MATDEEKKEIGETCDITTQENVSPRNAPAPTRQSTKQQVRHRASVACASCRDRRIRCVVPQGQSECNQCRRTGTECVIKNDDERRRPISKAYMSSLSERINLLEGMLMDKGVVPPPACHPPKTKHEAQNKSDDQQQSSNDGRSKSQQRAQATNSPCDVPSPPDSANDFIKPDLDQSDAIMTDSQVLQALSKEESPFRMLDPRQEDIVHRLLSTKGNLSFDQLSGRLRFFGPTANSHVYAESPDQFDSREPPEQVRRAERIIRSLSANTYEYLMNHFWEYYNGVIPVIDRDAFEADRESQNPRFYSSFLHIAILAMGYRGCDTEREDMRRISLGHRESTLHREAKYMLDIELERPGGIPSVQALLLLGDLECGVGRDNTGWMYAGMANRLAFDIGLHLDCRSNSMPEQEVHIRRMVMRACVIYDKYWALFLGRPTSIKNQDLGMELLSDKMALLTSDLPTPPERDINMEIYEQLIEVMELSGRIVESRDHHVINQNTEQNNVFAMSEAEDNAYLHVINLDRQLQNWYRRLPDHLAWKPANIKTAPYSFFLLHQQYHVSMILLHRPWARYGSITGDGASTGSHPSPESGGHLPVPPEAASQHPDMGNDHSLGMGDPHSMVHDSRASLSRSICTQQAIRVARIFWQHRQRFDGRKIFITGIQHAGTAVLALIAALAHQRSESDRRTYVGYLEILSDALGDMSHTYHPAGRMDDLLKAVLTQIRLSVGDSFPNVGHRRGFPFSGMPGDTGMSGGSHISAPLIPSRREASDSEMGQPFKKTRTGNSRRASEFSRPPPPFFSASSAQRQHMFNSLDMHQRNQSQMDSMLFSLGAADGHHIDLDFMNGSAIEMDPHDEHRGGRTDDVNLVTPSSENWGMNSMHSDHQPGNNSSNSNNNNNNNSNNNNGYEGGPGPAGLSAGSVLGQNSALSNGLLTGANFGLTKSDIEGMEDRAGAGNPHMGGVESGMNGMSPVSLSGLVQSVEKPPASENELNHDLDFFSFN